MRALTPCIVCSLNVDIQLPDDNEVQIILTAMVALESNPQQQQSTALLPNNIGSMRARLSRTNSNPSSSSSSSSSLSSSPPDSPPSTPVAIPNNNNNNNNNNTTSPNNNNSNSNNTSATFDLSELQFVIDPTSPSKKMPPLENIREMQVSIHWIQNNSNDEYNIL